MEADFSGYATKANLRCSDGRTITPDAFKDQDQQKVPLVWQHAHNEPSNVLGHAILENRPDGVYCYGYFNETDSGRNAKTLVEHGDVRALSIYANKLVEKSKNVIHGVIREVSIVLAGANPEAFIDSVTVAHADGTDEVISDAGVMYFDSPLEHGDSNAEVEGEEEVADVQHAEEKTAQDVFDSLNEEQRTVVFYMLSQALKGAVKHSDDAPENIEAIVETLDEDQTKVFHFMLGQALEHSEDEANDSSTDDVEETSETSADADEDTDNSAAHADNKEGTTTMANVFEQNEGQGSAKSGTTLTHSQQAEIFQAAKRGGSLKDAFLNYATDTLKHGIDDLELLFPDARNLTSTPDFLKRRTEWVSRVMTGTTHVPFARIKSMSANLTLEEARAKGYIKGNFKKEEFFRVARRITLPQTVYKKQKLDRDDIVDITDFDVVVWLKAEMRLMLEEELARAILLGDGRAADDEDKINEDNIRPIATDNDFYVTKLYTKFADIANGASAAEQMIDQLVLNRRHYRGSGNPTLFTSETVLAQLLLIKDSQRRRVYNTVADVAAAVRVSDIVTVEIMDEPTNGVLAVMVNLQDYTVGADRGGAVALFDDFDIDYNQFKYLIETRCSGALVKPKAAVVLLKAASTDVLVDPVAPTWNNTNKTVTVATTTGIVYRNKLSNQVLTTGSPVTLTEGDELRVVATTAAGYYLASNAADEYLFTFERGRVDAGIN